MRPSVQITSKATAFRRVLVMLLVTVAALVCLRTASLAEPADDYIFGTYTSYSTYTSGAPLADSYYYSDSWFSASPEERNDGLALMSMQLVSAAFTEDSNGNAASVLADLGFSTGFESVDSGSCGYAYGTKTLEDGSALVAIVIQSYSSDPALKTIGWQQNFTINGDNAAAGEQYSYACAADAALASVTSLASGNVKYWVCGQSRGGAIANILAQRLCAQGSSVFAYTFEAPATVDEAFATASYPGIHNYLTSDDIVTMVPMWGMTRYGVVHELETGTDDALIEELTKLGSDAANAEVNDYQENTAALIGYLEAKVGTRANYSATNTDVFDGGSVTYCYQDTFRNLIALIQGGEFKDLSLESVTDRIDDFAPIVYSLVDAVAAEEAGDLDTAYAGYRKAASDLRTVLLELIGKDSIGLTDTDVYVLLKLVAPFGVDTSFEPYDDPMSDMLGYLSPLVLVVMNAGSMTFSHHFDTLIARLKILAPQPELDEIDIRIDEPVAGDAATKAASEVEQFIEALGNSWLSAEAELLTDDETLESGRVYYLKVTLSAVAHAVDGDCALTLNGEDPVATPTVSYDEGTGIVTTQWVFAIGNPKGLTVTFDTLGYADAPEAISVPKGTMLRYEDAPRVDETVTVDGVTHRFGGWQAQDGTAWDDITVNDDMTVHAKWIPLVDDIRIGFTPPEPGGTFTAPTVPEDALYCISAWSVTSPDWEYVDTAELEGIYHLEVLLGLKDPDIAQFALDVEDLGDWVKYEYVGSAAVNGEGAEARYDEDSFYLSITYGFPVPEDWTESARYVFTEGDGQVWTKGSDKPAVFTVVNTVYEEDAWALFSGAEVDGAELALDTDYTAEEGSVILTLNAAYLEMLDEGEHTLTARFGDSYSAEATFTVAAPGAEPGGDTTPDDKSTDNTKPADNRRSNTPRTGDATDIAAAFAFLALAGLAFVSGKVLRGLR